MWNICKLCGKKFEAKVYNNYICSEPHYINCRICNKPVYMNGEENKKKRQMYFNKGYVYCSHECSCKGVGKDKYNKANENIDLNKLKYLKTKTNMFDTDIAKELGVSVDFVVDRCRHNNWVRPDNLKEELQKNKNTLISNQLKQKYKNEEVKNNMLQKAKETYKAKTGYDHNFKNPNEIKKYRQAKLEKYGNEWFTNSKKMVQTRKSKNNGFFWTDNQIEKVKQTKINRYGIIAPQDLYKNMNEKTKDIILHKELFIKYLLNIPFEKRTFTYIATSLGVSYATVNRHYHLYNCENKVPINLSISQEEKDLSIYIKNMYSGNIITNTKDVISPYELDIYIPEKNLALEYNGDYYHNISKINKDYHYKKSKLCEEKGIRLIHIYEHEWKNERQQPILENIIRNALGINPHKIYARKLKIEVKKSSDMREFFNNNNIQGFRGGKFAICLVNDNTDEVYMAYMMGKAFFGKGKYEWEVIRGATKLGYTVIGGASKIWKYFIENYNPKNCVYYIDYNYFNGNSLRNLPSMKFIKTQPSFKNFWVKEGRVKNREPKRNAEIKELYKSGEVLQIYNAGTKVYVWERD